MNEVEKLIAIYQQVEDAGLMVTAGKKSAAELMVSHDVVPVVRCKDCKHCDFFYPTKEIGKEPIPLPRSILDAVTGAAKGG